MSNCVDNELYCSGCSVCYAVCPANAITITTNVDGFYSAILDKTKCINCEKCLQVCTKFETNYSKSKDFKELPLYAGWSLDQKTQYETSSGGICFEIAKWAINNNYKVAGVIYDAIEERAKTVIASTLSEIEHFKGSKYLQSFCADTFKQIINSKDRFVIFGTPCQIAGLRMLAKENNCENRLILIDFFCHGVPTYLLWQSFLKWLKEKKNINQINNIKFRNKKYGWHNFTMQINGQTDLYLKKRNNPFYTLFFSDFLLNNACYLCKPKSSFNFADIRLGDFWGSTFDKREDGVSVVIPISQKAKDLINDLPIILEKQSHKICSNTQSVFKNNNIDSAKRDVLFNMLKNNQKINKLIIKYKNMLPFNKKAVLLLKQLLPSSILFIIRKQYHKWTGM